MFIIFPASITKHAEINRKNNLLLEIEPTSDALRIVK